MYAPNFAPIIMRLRKYQQYAVDSLYRYFEKNPEKGNPVIAMPTGTGKSLVIAGFIKGLFERWPTQRVMMLTHVKELIVQNADKVHTMWPAAPLGIFSAGLKSKESDYPITFAGIQSCKNAAALFAHIDLIIIDECHLVSANDNTSYRKFIAALQEINPKLRVIGLSATAYRLGLGMITDGGVFTDICCDMTDMDSFNWFVDEGYLSPLIPMPTDTVLDVDGVAKRGGEFIEKHLQNAVDKEEITEAALREALELAHDRERILVFATGVEHTEHITDMLNNMGETAVCVHSKMKGKKDEDGRTPRDAALHAHRTGQARWLVNNNVLTTGYDDEAIDCIIMLRPTNSPGLWVQMLGRGTRPYYSWGANVIPANATAFQRLEAIAASPKQTCLVLDFAGNTMRLGPVNDPQIPNKKGKGGGPPPVKYCMREKLVQHNILIPRPEFMSDVQWEEYLGQWDDDKPKGKRVRGCGAFNHTAVRNCCNCGAEFKFEPKITTTASSSELMRRKKPKAERQVPEIVTFDVDKVVYAVHDKVGAASSLKVTYHCGLRNFTEWVPAWHDSGIKYKGRAWWKDRTDLPLPDDAAEAVETSDELRLPLHIRVWLNKKYPEVVACLFNHETTQGLTPPTPTGEKVDPPVKFEPPKPQHTEAMQEMLEDDEIPF